MTCPYCGRPLVEVDNPMRREVRHRRGEEAACPGPVTTLPDDELRRRYFALRDLKLVGSLYSAIKQDREQALLAEARRRLIRMERPTDGDGERGEP